MKEICKSLLEEWCQALIQFQVKDTKDWCADGALYCPACGRIHGRCVEAMYPFLCFAHQLEGKEREKFIIAAHRLFLWAEANISGKDGSVLNDTDSEWKGTTVFYAIQLADCLEFHNEILPQCIKEMWQERLQCTADFLADFDELKSNNINYWISNALALLRCGQVLKKSYYLVKAKEWMEKAEDIWTENQLIYGEGVPKCRKSPRKCRPVDVGYNVEETLPSLGVYGWLSQEKKIMKYTEIGLESHLKFMMDDGGWDNSFGTRNFKWTYWGSRTSGGCALVYLLYEKRNNKFFQAAEKNIRLLKQCTYGGLLAGGPHYKIAGQLCCIHHTFTHAKVIAEILDRKIDRRVENNKESFITGLDRNENEYNKVHYYKEINTWIITRGDMRATITAYDWEYLTGGHVSGGTLSFLYGKMSGVLLCAGMGEYSRKEPGNMQIPRGKLHECLALRMEWENRGMVYSSIYEDKVQLEKKNEWIIATGRLKDKKHIPVQETDLAYEFRYRIRKNGIDVEARFSHGKLICPWVSREDEEIKVYYLDSNTGQRNIYAIDIEKERCTVKILFNGKIKLPYGRKRIFNLIPGLQALRIDGEPKNGYFFMKADILEK